MPQQSSQPGGRPLLPAPTDPSKRSEKVEGVTSQSNMPLPKRLKITPVACVPCQQRKSKCDGNRPICFACMSKSKNDCTYDSAGDMRRTSALKKRIDVLERENSDLQDIIRAVCANPSDETVRSYVQALPSGHFQNTAAVAAALRGQGASRTTGYSYPSSPQRQTAYQSSWPTQISYTAASSPYTVPISPSTSGSAWSTGEMMYHLQASAWRPGHGYTQEEDDDEEDE